MNWYVPSWCLALPAEKSFLFHSLPWSQPFIPFIFSIFNILSLQMDSIRTAVLCFAWNGKQTCSLSLLHNGNSIPDIFSLGKEGWRVLAGLRSCKCIKLHPSMSRTSSANRELQTLRCPSPAGSDSKNQCTWGHHPENPSSHTEAATGSVHAQSGNPQICKWHKNGKIPVSAKPPLQTPLCVYQANADL